MSDRLAAYVRTYWPWLLGHLTAIITASIAARLGVTVDHAIVYEALALGLSAAVYAAGRWLEARPGDGPGARLARAVARWLLALGLTTGQPVYGLPPAQTESEAELYPDGSPARIRSVTTWPPR